MIVLHEVAGRRWLLGLAAAVLIAEAGLACQPESIFLFRSEARTRLDSLQTRPTEANLFDRFALMHNLAFGQDEEMRKAAEKLLEDHFDDERPLLLQGYVGSLKMIRVSHRSAGSKVFRSLNPFATSPRDEARDGFRQISETLAKDSTNPVLRLLRATAAAESAEHLPELFDTARIDLAWLSSYLTPRDSVRVFLTELNWAKYYYKLSRKLEEPNLLFPATEHVSRAIAYACTPVYRDRAEEWWLRIKTEIDDSEVFEEADSLSLPVPELSVAPQ